MDTLQLPRPGSFRPRPAFRLGVVAAFLLLSGGCAGDAKEPARPVATREISTPAPGPDGERIFDPARLQVGDRVLGLRVVAADISVAHDSTHVGDVRFAGRIRVRGRTMRHPDHPNVDLVCFDVDSSSVNALPRWPRDERRRVWLCFDNRDEAVRQLGPSRDERPVTIEIDDYQTVRHYTDAFDTARLVRVIPAP